MTGSRHLHLVPSGRAATRPRVTSREAEAGAARIAGALAIAVRRTPGTKSRRLYRWAAGEKPVAPGLFHALDEILERAAILDAPQQQDVALAVEDVLDELESEVRRRMAAAWGVRPPPCPGAPALRRVA